MPKSFEMDGDRWLVTMDTKAAHAGMTALVFHCVTDSQRPYRVLEIPSAKLDSSFTERDLRSHFANSQTMDFSLEPEELATHRSYGEPRQDQRE